METRLQILNGPQAGSAISLRSGQIVRFGRTAWAEVAFPYDDQLADVHFSLETTRQGVALVDLSAGRGTKVDGQPVRAKALLSGQKIQAGSLEFLLEFTPSPATFGGALLVTGDSSGAPAALPFDTSQVPLTKAARGKVQPDMSAAQFLSSLAQARLWLDGWNVISAVVGKARVVGWTAGEFLRLRGEQLSVDERELLEAVCDWAREPLAAELGALRKRLDQDDERNTSSAWVALAATWCGESLAGPELPVVPPPPGLVGNGLQAAWNFLAAEISIPQPADFFADSQQRALAALGGGS